MMTYPLIGNYGINRDDYESIVPAVFGFVVKDYCDAPSNWRSQETLDSFLKRENIPGITASTLEPSPASCATTAS